LSVVPCAGGWAIKHGDGFLGVAADRDEALRLVEVLQGAPPASSVTVSSQSA
jgi:hypothetical protein